MADFFMTNISTLRLSNLKARWLNLSGYDCLRIVLGLVLLAAAGLKGYQLATEPMLGKALFTSRWFQIIDVEFELALGIFLLSGIYKRLLWLVALLCFSCFACITLYKALSGQASCGCFGKVEINPWYTFIFDAVVVGLLINSQPRLFSRWQQRTGKGKILTASSVSLFVLLYCGWAMATYRPARLNDEGHILGNDDFVILEPEKWVGKPFPLLKYIDIGEKLAKKKWIVVLFDHDCAICQEIIPKYYQLAQKLTSHINAPRIALVEIPPFGKPGEHQNPRDSLCVLGQLSQEKEWFIQTPSVITMNDSKVEDVSEEAINDFITYFIGGRVYKKQPSTYKTATNLNLETTTSSIFQLHD